MSDANGSRTRVRRSAHKQRTDRAELDAVLDTQFVAHVGFADGETPYVIPVAYARDGDRLLLHGSTASRMFRRLASGVPCCITVTTLDAMVVARSAFESSMHYRSAMVLGEAHELTDAADHLHALRVLTDHLIPGRWDEVRASLTKELRATSVVAVPIVEWSVKVSGGQPDDGDEDVATDTWAGIVPIRSIWDAPRAADNLRDGIPVPASVRALIGEPAYGGSSAREPDHA